MTIKQPEALRLADALDHHSPHRIEREAAAELRRLHEVNAELLEALRLIQPVKCDNLHHEKKHQHSYAEACPVKEWIDEVIAKATGEQYEN